MGASNRGGAKRRGKNPRGSALHPVHRHGLTGHVSHGNLQTSVALFSTFKHLEKIIEPRRSSSRERFETREYLCSSTLPFIKVGKLLLFHRSLALSVTLLIPPPLFSTADFSSFKILQLRLRGSNSAPHTLMSKLLAARTKALDANSYNLQIGEVQADSD
ncbi:uncharacterized protein LOC125206280 [Salvia hispanica]|uniref:uncharacterized protein LOC125206280 n=1 Tax=Salvia hispanica TaxID=49212 RepID=UPI0020094ED7|nr:uncharacterized protein LOC125206280 [Salvia hispanica]